MSYTLGKMSGEGAVIESVGELEAVIGEDVPLALGSLTMPDEAKASYFLVNSSNLPSCEVTKNQLMIEQLAYHGVNATEVRLD